MADTVNDSNRLDLVNKPIVSLPGNEFLDVEIVNDRANFGERMDGGLLDLGLRVPNGSGQEWYNFRDADIDIIREYVNERLDEVQRNLLGLPLKEG